MNVVATSIALAVITGVLLAWALARERFESRPNAAPAETSATGTETKTWSGEKVVKTDAEWGKQLTRKQFAVTRRKKTEPAFRNKYWKHKRNGTYKCVCCDLPLFHSSAKYASGTGWPTFWKPIDETCLDYKKERSFFTIRVEVKCVRCDAHVGHVFGDGPPTTGLRYCVNSAALDFEGEPSGSEKQTGVKKDRSLRTGR